MSPPPPTTLEELEGTPRVLATALRLLEVIVARLDRLESRLPPALVDVPTAGERLGCSASTIRRRVRDGTLPVVRVGRSVRIDLAALRPPSDEQIAELAREARGR